ncbi:MAG TPA: SDR family oxidoreductase [Burkholderiales bacterium]|nr:SDR family oxidoreductase [Burkholderiales bacterium]
MKRRLLIVGCGDVALRAVPLLARRYKLLALTHSPERRALLRGRGIVPLAGNLDSRRSLRRLAGLADSVLHLAPPPGSGTRDPRTVRLLAALARRKMLPRRLVYISTSGVYGDCGGERVPETRRLRPGTDRARRRVHAEGQVRAWGTRNRVSASILRVPGIYAADRLPLERLRAGTPALVPWQDSYTNHIHGDDLARAIVAALARGRPGRAYNASDDSDMKMGEYFDLVADAFGLRRPLRVSRAAAAARIPESLLSFMRESRRLSNRRMKRELGVRLRYPRVADGIAAARRGGLRTGKIPR